jgi:dipeptidyl aminopeptidase/acylaminoacyl peptidase
MKYALLLSIAAVMNYGIAVGAQGKMTDKMKNTDITQFKADPSNASKKPFNAEALMSLKRLSDPKLSPDGKWVLFNQSTTVMNDNKFQKDIYKVSTDGKTLVQLTNDPKADIEARWSPDGSKIAFVSNREKGFQLYTMNPDGSGVKKITDIENGVSNIAWSPDGKFISFTSDVKLDQTVFDKYPQYAKANLKIYKKLPIRHWDEWEDENSSHLFIISANGGEAKDLMNGEPYDCPLKPSGGSEQIAWSPDSKEIAYVCKKSTGLDFVQNTNSRVYLYNLETKTTKCLADDKRGYDLDPLYSPDGAYIAFTSMEHNSFESDRRRLMLYDRKSEKTHELSSKLDQWVGDKVWSPDSKYMYFCAEDTGSVQVYKMAVKDGSWEFVTNGWYNHEGGLQISKDGSFIVYGRESISEPTDFYKMDLKSKAITRLTSVNSEEMNKWAKVNVAQRWVKSRDGKDVHCWIVYPPNFDPNKKYPMISYLQGGPQSMLSQNFHFRWNYLLMASHGYVLMLPNRRGVPGFGQEWNNAISKDWGGHPMEDILDCTDDLSKESYIDKDGRCAVGASAGGYTAYWMEGHHEKRFKAFIAHCGVFNLESMYGATEELWFPNWEYGGPYWENGNMKFYDKNSPHNYVNNWDTPILISTGERDFRVPYTQSLEAFTAAQVKGIPSELIVFPDETHFIAKPQEFVIWNSEFFEFLDKYCKHK